MASSALAFVDMVLGKHAPTELPPRLNSSNQSVGDDSTFNRDAGSSMLQYNHHVKVNCVVWFVWFFFAELIVTRWHDKFEGLQAAPHGDTSELYVDLLCKEAAFLTSIPPPEQGTTRRDLEVAAMKHFLVYDGKRFPDDISGGMEHSKKKMSVPSVADGSNPPDGLAVLSTVSWNSKRSK